MLITQFMPSNPEMTAFLAIYEGIACLGAVIGFVSAIFAAIGFYSVAKRRGISRPWLVWLPLGQSWILGSISDHYQLEINYRTKNKRKTLLWLQIVMLVLTLLVLLTAATTIFTLIEALKSENQLYPFVDFMKPVRDNARDMLLVYLALLVVSVVMTVVQYIALFDVFQSCSPENATLLLVLSILIPVAMPFLVFAIRGKDLGMRT